MPPIDFYNNNDSRTHLRAYQTPTREQARLSDTHCSCEQRPAEVLQPRDRFIE